MVTFKPVGVLPAMVTPPKDDELVDQAGQRKLTRFPVDGVVQGLFPLGTGGPKARLKDVLG